MVTLTQCDEKNHVSTGRNRGKHTFRPVGRPANGKAMSNMIAGEKLTFGEDFVLEHSASRLSITVVKVSGDIGSVRKDMQYSPQAYGFPC